MDRCTNIPSRNKYSRDPDFADIKSTALHHSSPFYSPDGRPQFGFDFIPLKSPRVCRGLVFFRAVHRQADHPATAGLEILLCDRGPAIKRDQWCMRRLEEVRPGGLGLHFIQQSMDIVEYKRAKGTNRLRLVKYVRAPQREVKS